MGDTSTGMKRYGQVSVVRVLVWRGMGGTSTGMGGNSAGMNRYLWYECRYEQVWTGIGGTSTGTNRYGHVSVVRVLV